MKPFHHLTLEELKKASGHGTPKRIPDPRPPNPEREDALNILHEPKLPPIMVDGYLYTGLRETQVRKMWPSKKATQIINQALAKVAEIGQRDPEARIQALEERLAILEAFIAKA